MKKYDSSDSEDGGCLNGGFAKRILSKTSLKSSSSSGKSAVAARAEETKLHLEVDHLKQTIENLNQIIDNKDSAIGNLVREKQNLYVELKKVQRTNRNIQQQLEDERDFYQKEKEHYCQEIVSAKRSLRHGDQQSIDAVRIKQLESEISTKQEHLEQKDKVIYNLCVKYMKIQTSKATLRSKMEKTNTQHQQAYDYIVSLLDSSRGELDKLLRDKIHASTTSMTSKKYLNLVRRNARLHYENTQLKIRLAALADDEPQCHGERNETKTTKKSKSDGKVQESNGKTDSKAKEKRSIHTLRHDETDFPCCFNRRIAGRNFNGYNMLDSRFDYPRLLLRRPRSDPG